jgi:hypothetical protein
MAAPKIADYIKYANLQMASESLFGFDATVQGANLTPRQVLPSAEIDPLNLELGNRHTTKFTSTEASKFAAQWSIESHISNTATGFSGTLFKNKVSGELTISFRSTEFIDDFARDNQATNTLEIKDLGFAFGQLADMKIWYEQLKSAGKITGPLTVTGYSLGGHLATAFNLMYPLEAQRVINFNRAGLGKTGDGSFAATQQELPQMIASFNQLRAQSSTALGLEDQQKYLGSETN